MFLILYQDIAVSFRTLPLHCVADLMWYMDSQAECNPIVNFRCYSVFLFTIISFFVGTFLCLVIVAFKTYRQAHPFPLLLPQD